MSREGSLNKYLEGRIVLIFRFVLKNYKTKGENFFHVSCTDRKVNFLHILLCYKYNVNQVYSFLFQIIPIKNLNFLNNFFFPLKKLGFFCFFGSFHFYSLLTIRNLLYLFFSSKKVIKRIKKNINVLLFSFF